MKQWWEVAEIELEYPLLKIRVKHSGIWREFMLTFVQAAHLKKELEKIV